VAWGYNGYGQCTLPSPNTGFTAIAAGNSHSLGLKTDGSIVAWGRNDYGQCTVPSPNTGFTAIAAGGYHSLGLKQDGSIVAWGRNDYGQCTVPSPNTGFTAIAAGGYHSLGLKGCQFDLAGDLNDDYEVDFSDFALMANNWLIDCQANPFNPACVPIYAPIQTVVPNVTGMTQAAAQASIVAASLVIGTVTQQYSNTIAAGLVISQTPASGAIVNVGSAVNLVVSKGPEGPAGMVWVYINDHGVSGHEGFTGEMSKYETTNAQYCQFLNAALASGDITVSGGTVWGANGSNGGADFVGRPYYGLSGIGHVDGGVYGGPSRINYAGSSFTVDSGFENHPVTQVSWYGATAFCNYYGYRLPTEWEWQAVADFNGSFIYGCGTTLNNSIANYSGSIHPYGLTDVGAFGTYGYGMCDMAGNAWEWTSSLYDPFFNDDVVVRGGGWSNSYIDCTVLIHQNGGNPGLKWHSGGFRVCREPDITWVGITDPGFAGQMSKYETTNTQYCRFLNAAKASNQITVFTDDVVYATSDTSHSQPYYNLAGVGYTYNGATNGGEARINYTDGAFTVDSGFENRPVTYVSWYGSTAFCNYYGYRLPTEWEWQAVADFDGSYVYGCGTTITNSKANYSGSTHPNGTTAVGAFGTYGYGMADMAGNVFEWTSTVVDGGSRVIRGGGWYDLGDYCTVSTRSSHNPDGADGNGGFRVCR
jgi:formylglycine-generating enzyme required for sulfatase activity